MGSQLTPTFKSKLPPGRQRAAALIIRDHQILLIRRIRDGQEYYIFPGGGIEAGETPEQAVRREIQEELTMSVSSCTPAFDIDNDGHREWYFLVDSIAGEPVLGGEEKERMNESNQYHPVWVPLSTALTLDNLYPIEARNQLTLNSQVTH